MELTSIDSETAIGRVRLTVSDLDHVQRFYERALGLRALECTDRRAVLGPGSGAGVVELAADPGASDRPWPSTGLYHFALLFPTRLDLARALARVMDAGFAFDGASDHLVSEALYLTDPEGNGIELYRDRPRSEWSYVDGTLQMSTEPLDIDGLAAELARGGRSAEAPDTTIVGHIHLHVSDLGEAESFYHGLLGFDVTVRAYGGALFLSAGGYHHHIGVNIWGTRAAPAPPPRTRGLDWFELRLASPDELRRLSSRLAARGFEPTNQNDGVLVADPAGNRLLLSA